MAGIFLPGLNGPLDRKWVPDSEKWRHRVCLGIKFKTDDEKKMGIYLFS